MTWKDHDYTKVCAQEIRSFQACCLPGRRGRWRWLERVTSRKVSPNDIVKRRAGSSRVSSCRIALELGLAPVAVRAGFGGTIEVFDNHGGSVVEYNSRWLGSRRGASMSR